VRSGRGRLRGHQRRPGRQLGGRGGHLLGWLFLGTFELVCPPSCEDEAPQIAGFTFLGCNEQGYPEYTHDVTGIIFVRLPGGKFNMGSPADEPFRDVDEGPVHEVTLSPFLMGKHEVTQAQWKQVMGLNPSCFQVGQECADRLPPDGNGDNLPVEQVSWDDCQEFEAKTGLTLPTEAQWEYACRAGTQTAFSFGSGAGCADWECGTAGIANVGRMRLRPKRPTPSDFMVFMATSMSGARTFMIASFTPSRRRRVRTPCPHRAPGSESSGTAPGTGSPGGAAPLSATGPARMSVTPPSGSAPPSGRCHRFLSQSASWVHPAGTTSGPRRFSASPRALGPGSKSSAPSLCLTASWNTSKQSNFES
jgi:hypothetical protein